MLKLSHVVRTVDASVHAAHSGMIIGHNLNQIVLGHLSLDVVFAVYVLARLAVELALLAIRGWRRVTARCAGRDVRSCPACQPANPLG